MVGGGVYAIFGTAAGLRTSRKRNCSS